MGACGFGKYVSEAAVEETAVGDAVMATMLHGSLDVCSINAVSSLLKFVNVDTKSG
jgi:hypothetical protein